MLRRKGPSNPAADSPNQPSPLSNFSVRFAVNRDDDTVDITEDLVDYSGKPSPPNSLPGDLTLLSRPKVDEGDGFSVRSTSPSTTPIVDRVSSFRENLKQRFEKHRRKNSDGEEIPPKNLEVPTAGSTSSPSFLGKFVKKLEDRKHSSVKEASPSPMNDDSAVEMQPWKSFSSANQMSSAKSNVECSDTFSVKSEPSFREVDGFQYVDVVKPRRIASAPRLRKVTSKESENREDFSTDKTRYFQPLFLVAALLVAIVVVPMPSFMSGLLFGCIFTAATSVKIWFTVLYPTKTATRSERVPAGLEAVGEGAAASWYGSEEDEGIAWMNQMVGDFDVATFHVNQTQSVFVTLDGPDLRIQKPKTRVLPRRAMFDEELPGSVTFVGSRIYNISGAEVQLVPVDIPRKRRWVWRFPIAIKLTDPASIATLKSEIQENMLPDKPLPSSHQSPTLYLCARSDREKLDWFWRLTAASGRSEAFLYSPKLSPNLSTLNLLFRRILSDVLIEPTWKTVIEKKIQKKLSVIRLPYFIEELHITDMDLGKHLPMISNVSQQPGVDERGVWVEMDFEYHGTVQMTLATKLNLMRLKKDKDHEQEGNKDIGSDNEVQMDTVSIGSTDSISGFSTLSSRDRSSSHVAPSGDKDPATNYESDESDEFDEAATAAPEGGKDKLMRYVEKIRDSKAFQKLTDVGIVRRAMENVSDTDLTLTVVVERLAGRLAINLPHPPSDKLWYGFVVKPDLHLRAFPKLGEREVTFNQVTDWIEKKLTSEFHRLITVPNMDDLTIPVMNSGLDDEEFRLQKLSDLILK